MNYFEKGANAATFEELGGGHCAHRIEKGFESRSAIRKPVDICFF